MGVLEVTRNKRFSFLYTIYICVYCSVYPRNSKSTHSKKINSEMFSLTVSPNYTCPSACPSNRVHKKRGIAKPTLCLLLENHTEEKRSSFAKASFCLWLYEVGWKYAKLSFSAVHTDTHRYTYAGIKHKTEIYIFKA